MARAQGAGFESAPTHAHSFQGSSLLLTDESELALLGRSIGTVPLAVFVRSSVPELLEKLPEGSSVKHFLALCDGAPDPLELEALFARLVEEHKKPHLAARHWLGTVGLSAMKSGSTQTAYEIRTFEEKARVLSSLTDAIFNHVEPPHAPSLPASSSVPEVRDMRAFEYARKAVDVADELILNAVFDANPRLRGLCRGHPFVLTKEESVLVTWGLEPHRLAVSVTDPFGTLRFSDVFDQLRANNRPTDITARASAGLGLRMAFQSSSALFMDVDAGKSTQIVALMRIEKTFREFEKMGHSLHFFGGGT